MADYTYFQKRMGLLNLTADQMEQLHLATLDILEQVGVKILETEALELLNEAGARINGDLVKIQPWMVQQALQTTPCKIAIYDRLGNRAMTLEKGRIYYGTGSDTPYVMDIDSGNRRRSVKQDSINATIVTDALDHIDFVMSMAQASDVPAVRSDRHHFEAMILNTTKPIVFDAHDRQGLLDIIYMASLACGGREELTDKPYIIHYSEPSSPLVHSKNALEKLLTAASERIPLIYAPAVMCGATGPVTSAGSLVVANAEILSGLVIHQLKARGAPFIYGGGVPPLNMGTTVCSYGDPQAILDCACLVEMSHYYNLPSFTTAGCTDAQCFDQQAATEVAFSLLISALAGGNLIHDIGYIGAGMATSLEQVVLCNESIGAIKYLTRGVEINPATLAMDIIEKVGPGGHFLTEQHTMDNFRTQMHFTKLFNRSNHENWVAAGSKCFGDSANALVKEILKWHEVKLLDPEVEKAIKAVAEGEITDTKLA
ncbi:MAG: trimethylamine methyltransferase family protein [Dethiobacteria bacterium]